MEQFADLGLPRNMAPDLRFCCSLLRMVVRCCAASRGLAAAWPRPECRQAASRCGPPHPWCQCVPEVLRRSEATEQDLRLSKFPDVGGRIRARVPG